MAKFASEAVEAPQVGSLVIARFVRDEVPIVAGRGSIGEMVERALADMVAEGMEQAVSITVNIGPDLWRSMGGRIVVND